MPLLAFFSRNKKSRNPAQVTPKSSEHASSASHSPISPGADYVAPDTSLPSNPNGKNIYHHPGSNSSKLRLPFTRKESALASVPVVAPDKSTTPARPSFASNSTLASEADRSSESRSRTPRSQLRPPPSKSAIFAAYGDPHSAFSTRSLPARYPTPQTPTEPPLPNSPLPPLPSAKKSFFAWPKTKNKTVPELAKPSPPPSLPALPNLTSSQDRDSFNLKSFRHLSPPSPEDTLPPPVPRPRIDSFASDSSQRISVAAFREAQSRRSLAGSPVPSFRSPSPGPCGSSSHLPRNASPHVPNNDGPRLLRNESPVPSKAAPRQNSIPYPRPPPKHAMGPRRSTALTLSIASSSALTASIAPNSSSDDSRDEDSDEYGSGEVNIAGKMGRQRTITKGRNPTKAKSESGHGFGDRRLADRAQSSIGMHNDMTVVGNVTKANALPPRSQSSLGVYSGPRPRASASASALTSAAAAARKTEVPTAPHATPSAKTSTAGPNPGLSLVTPFTST
jgi:hypothetical protein